MPQLEGITQKCIHHNTHRCLADRVLARLRTQFKDTIDPLEYRTDFLAFKTSVGLL